MIVKIIMAYLDGFPSYFRYWLTNAANEAFTTEINVVKRRAYGFHDLDYFKVKILQASGVILKWKKCLLIE